MNYKVETIPNFDRELKRLAKKYPSLEVEVDALGQLLEENPEQGTAIGKSCYKIRLAIKSKGRGKSGGARVITCVVAIDERVVLLSHPVRQGRTGRYCRFFPQSTLTEAGL